MTRKKILAHSIALIAICLFGVLALGSTTSAPKVAGETIISSVTREGGFVQNMPELDGKAYSILGMVFATSETSFDEKGLEMASQEGIVMMLLREAHKLGADDIINLRWSENTIWIESTSTSGSSSTKKMTKIVTHNGNALAIKYSDQVSEKGNSLFDGKFVPGNVTIDGTIKQ